ncbi:MAG: hypothetical protein FWF20_08115, partial [Betaproteobacteria bacterium]|nr:hypothetical protein [Betaproteobacteria bacterium]MCL2886729.1 hypothetical protein [Betaproteobacteria bacterium]
MLPVTPSAARRWRGFDARNQAVSQAETRSSLILHHVRYTLSDMKTATLPPVRIDPGFRHEVEQSLQDGESLTALVKTALRHEIARRKNHSEFVR